jgi:hypothetical protein
MKLSKNSARAKGYYEKTSKKKNNNVDVELP